MQNMKKEILVGMNRVWVCFISYGVLSQLPSHYPCKDDDRKGGYPNEKFDFLGFTFRARRSKNRWGKHFVNFSPAVSRDAATRMRQEMRRWQVQLRSDKSLEDISRMFDPILRGWITYYSSYYKSELYPVLRHFNRTLVRWATRKYKRFRRHRRQAEH